MLKIKKIMFEYGYSEELLTIEEQIEDALENAENIFDNMVCGVDDTIDLNDLGLLIDVVKAIKELMND